jgi:hypothetical protein
MRLSASRFSELAGVSDTRTRWLGCRGVARRTLSTGKWAAEISSNRQTANFEIEKKILNIRGLLISVVIELFAVQKG